MQTTNEKIVRKETIVALQRLVENPCPRQMKKAAKSIKKMTSVIQSRTEPKNT